MSVAAFCGWLLLLGADPNPFHRFVDQKEWHGSVVWRIHGAVSDDGGTFNVDRTVELTFRIDMFEDLDVARKNAQEARKALELQAKRGVPVPAEAFEALSTASDAVGFWGPDKKGEVNQSLVWNVHDSIGGPRRFTSFEGNGKLEGVWLDALWIDPKRGTYDLHAGALREAILRVTVTQTDDEGKRTVSAPRNESHTLSLPDFEVKGSALPDDGLELFGEMPFQPHDAGDDPSLRRVEKLKGTITWTLSPKPLPRVGLRFEVEDYETWRPKGSLRDEAEPGNDVRVRVWLEAEGGGAVAEKFKYVNLYLDDVTRIPGTCINFPRRPKNPPDPDLRFLEEWNPEASAKTEGTILQFKGNGRTGLTAVLSSFDWGGFGVLRVEARLESARFLLGERKGRPGVYSVRIPKSREDSKIADAWRKRTKAEGADDSDEDAEPKGDTRYKGDGLTLYEEYRGWHEWGTRAEDEFEGGGDPDTKEFFICDLSGEDTDFVFKFLQSLTGLRVVSDLMEVEIARDRTINFNHSRDTPHVVAQHAVVVMGAAGLGDPRGSPQAHEAGTPAWRGLVFLRSGPTGPASGPESLLHRANRGSALLHDLLHCCNVPHHAPATVEERTGVKWTLGKDDDMRPCLMEGAVRIRVLRESDGFDVSSSYIDQLLSPASVGYLPARIGSWQGAGCGHPYCVMASSDARYFRSRRDPRVRYIIRPDERDRSSWFICDSPNPPSKSSNAEDHDPESHFGPAPSGGGACLRQIVVNDAAHPVPR